MLYETSPIQLTPTILASMIYQTRSMRITERARIDTRIITRGYLDAIGGIPADLYDKENSHRILEITRGFFEWMMKLEDLNGL